MTAVDTNILIYSLDDDEPAKQKKARALIAKLHKPPRDAYMPWRYSASSFASSATGLMWGR